MLSKGWGPSEIKANTRSRSRGTSQERSVEQMVQMELQRKSKKGGAASSNSRSRSIKRHGPRADSNETAQMSTMQQQDFIN